jgi:Tfp pilus assembly protein PilE
MPLRAHAKGDTIVEVMFAVAIFGVVAMVAIQMMNRGTTIAQTAIEAQQARNEMDAQAAAIKFIHDSFLSEREVAPANREYQDLWDALVSNARPSTGVPPYDANSTDNCSATMNTADAFVVNTRALQPRGNVNQIVWKASAHGGFFAVPQTYPRIVYIANNPNLADSSVTSIHSVEGLQVFAVRSATTRNGQPEYFDFHIRACWRAAGQRVDSHLSTVTRALNPRAIE